MGAIPEKALEAGSMIVGRAAEADWSIPDPERVLSKAHCRIDRKGEGFFLTDLSTNGIRVNGVPVTPGVPSPLADGDRLLLGDAIVGVILENVSAKAADAPPAVADTADPFPDGPFGFDTAAPEPPAQAPKTEAAAASAAAPETRVMQDWWDPSAASGKSDVPDWRNPGPESLDSPSVPASAAHRASAAVNGMEDIVMMAATVDKAALIRALDAAVSVLDGEREKFMQRLRQLLSEESSRWG